MNAISAEALLNPIAACIALVAFWSGLAYAGVFLYAGPEHTLLGLACLSSVMICLLPFVIRREFDIFEPMGYILILTIIAMPLRHLYLVLNPPERYLKLTNGEPIEFFIPAAVMIDVALAGLVCGYLCTTYRFKIERIGIMTSTSWRTPWFWPVTLIAVGISAMAFLYLVNLTGFKFDSENIARLSKKRSASGNVLGAYLSMIIDMARYIFWVTIAYVMSRRRRITGAYQVALLLIAVVAIVPPFFVSSRSGILVTAVVGISIFMYMGGKMSVRKAMLLMVPVLGLVSIVTMFRGRGAEWTGIGDVFNPLLFLNSVAGAWNYGGFVATAHVMDAFGLENYTFGSTLAFWTYAWIPRSIWTGKPLEIGYVLLSIFDFRGDVETRRGGGAAAGLPAEVYLNFGPYLTPLAMFVFGAFIRAVYNSLRPLARTSPVAAVFCGAFSFAMAHSYGYSLSRGMLMAGSSAIVLGLLFLVLLRWTANRT